MLGVPVVGITEAALHAACLLGGRYGAIVMSASSGPILREMAEAYGLGSRLGPIRALPVTPRDVLADPVAVTRAVGEAAHELALGGEVDAVVLIGAVMAGVPAAVQSDVPVPVLEGVSAAVGLLEGLVRLRPIAPRAGSFAAPPAARIDAMLQSLNGLF